MITPSHSGDTATATDTDTGEHMSCARDAVCCIDNSAFKSSQASGNKKNSEHIARTEHKAKYLRDTYVSFVNEHESVQM